MTDEEKKVWGIMLDIAKRNLSMPITDKQFRAAQQIFLTADAELRRLREAVEWVCNLPFEFGDGSIAHDKEISFRNELRRRAYLTGEK